MQAAIDTRIQSQAAALQPPRHGRLYWAVSDALMVAKRSLLHIPRIPTLLLDVTVQPIIFVILFRYVFGGAINSGNVSYVNFLLPGIFVQTLMFNGINTSVGLAEDLNRGLIDRFRSLPIARSAVMAGRTIADLATSLIGILVMMGVGLAVGFRPGGSALEIAAAIGLLLLFAFASLWLGIAIGLLVPNAESAQAVGFIAIFPITFASSAFVPPSTMPSWLRGFVVHQPFTTIVDAVRHLFLGQPVGSSFWLAVAWCLMLIVVLAPLSVWLYQRRMAR